MVGGFSSFFVVAKLASFINQPIPELQLMG
jgi:hypothetical protein